MRQVSIVFLTTANVITSIITVALGGVLFVFTQSEESVIIQSYQGIYLIFILFLFFEVFKWYIYWTVMQFKHNDSIRFLIIYGLFIITISFVYQFNFLSLTGLLYIVVYFLLKNISHVSNVIIEKSEQGKPLASDELFHPIKKDENND